MDTQGHLFTIIFFSSVANWEQPPRLSKMFATQCLMSAQQANTNRANIKFRMYKLARILWRKWVDAYPLAPCNHAMKRAPVLWQDSQFKQWNATLPSLFSSHWGKMQPAITSIKIRLCIQGSGPAYNTSTWMTRFGPRLRSFHLSKEIFKLGLHIKIEYIS